MAEPVWTFGPEGAPTWYEQRDVVYEGQYAWATPEELEQYPDDPEIWMETPCSGPGEIHFAFRIDQSEQYYGDVLIMYVDGERYEGWEAYEFSIPWTEITRNISVGEHVVRFLFRKYSSGGTAYLDAVDVPDTDWTSFPNHPVTEFPLHHRVPIVNLNYQYQSSSTLHAVNADGNVLGESNNVVYSNGDAIAVVNDGENPIVLRSNGNTYGSLGDYGSLELSDVVSMDGGGVVMTVDKYGRAMYCGRSSDSEPYDVGWENLVFVRYGGRGEYIGLRLDGTVYCSVTVAEDCPISTDIRDIDIAETHCLACRADGTAYAWSYSIYSDYDHADVGGWTDIIQISAGRFTSYGLRSDGTVVGKGDYSTDVETWTDIVAIEADSHRAGRLVGIKSDGTAVATWTTLDWENIKHRTVATHLSEDQITGTTASVLWLWLFDT